MEFETVYKISLVVKGEEKDIEKFLENNVVSCPYIEIIESEVEEKKQPPKDITKRPYIYERNPDTGEIFRRRALDYNNRECINPAVNSVPNV